jgi:hypothetical protein
MGWFQDTVWNNIFMYAYPISFLGSMAYGILSILQTDPSQVIANKNMVLALNIFVGICGLLGFGAWFGMDMSGLTFITQYIDFDVNIAKDKVVKQN